MQNQFCIFIICVQLRKWEREATLDHDIKRAKNFSYIPKFTLDVEIGF